MSIFVVKPASAVKRGSVLLALGWGDRAETVSKVDTTVAGVVTLTTQAGRYRLKPDTLVCVRQAPT